MKYENIVKGKFIERPNRFVAEVEIDGRRVRTHVKNTGRCKELLVSGAVVYLEDFDGRMGNRKMRYSLIAVEKGNLLVNMDSQAPNKICEEGLLSGVINLPGMAELSVVQREKTYGNSRFDFYLEDVNGKRGWLEVKGVTLEEQAIASFPDAPTERGTKHVMEMTKAVREGFAGYILFIVQMKGMKCIKPNDEHDPDFGRELRRAAASGVNVLAWDCLVEPSEIKADERVEVIL